MKEKEKIELKEEDKESRKEQEILEQDKELEQTIEKAKENLKEKLSEPEKLCYSIKFEIENENLEESRQAFLQAIEVLKNHIEQGKIPKEASILLKNFPSQKERAFFVSKEILELDDKKENKELEEKLEKKAEDEKQNRESLAQEIEDYEEILGMEVLPHKKEQLKEKPKEEEDQEEKEQKQESLIDKTEKILSGNKESEQELYETCKKLQGLLEELLKQKQKITENNLENEGEKDILRNSTNSIIEKLDKINKEIFEKKDPSKIDEFIKYGFWAQEKLEEEITQSIDEAQETAQTIEINVKFSKTKELVERFRQELGKKKEKIKNLFSRFKENILKFSLKDLFKKREGEKELSLSQELEKLTPEDWLKEKQTAQITQKQLKKLEKQKKKLEAPFQKIKRKLSKKQEELYYKKSELYDKKISDLEKILDLWEEKKKWVYYKIEALKRQLKYLEEQRINLLKSNLKNRKKVLASIEKEIKDSKKELSRYEYIQSLIVEPKEEYEKGNIGYLKYLFWDVNKFLKKQKYKKI